MSRRDTILVAVLINVGLLVVLFVGALKPDRLPEVPKAPIALEAPRVEPITQTVDPVDHLLKTYVEEAAKEPELIEVVKPILVREEPIKSVQKKDNKVIEVVVKQGDVLEKIARMNNTTVEEIIKLNSLPNTKLHIGQILYVPDSGSGAAVSVKETVASDEKYYIVKNGDNPWSIAIKNHIKFDELLRLNHLDEEKAKKLKPGDKLRIK